MRRFLFAIVIACMAVPAAAQTKRERFVISLNGIYQTGTANVTSIVGFTVNAEPTTFTSAFRVKDGPGFEGSARYNVRGPLAIGVGVSHFSASGAAEITAKIPHPFFFNQPRTVTGSANLSRTETTVRLALVLHSKPGRKLQYSAFAGPAYFTIDQTLVDAITYTDAYPYDTATFGTATTKGASKTKVGFAAGADLSYFFSKSIGVGAAVTIARATGAVPVSDGTSLNVQAGGTQAGAGVRFRF